MSEFKSKCELISTCWWTNCDEGSGRRIWAAKSLHEYNRNQRWDLIKRRKCFDPLYCWWSMSLRSQKKAEKTRFNFHSKGTMEKELSCIKQHQYLQSCKQLYKYHLSPSTPLFPCFLTSSSTSLPMKYFIQQKQNHTHKPIFSQNKRKPQTKML